MPTEPEPGAARAAEAAALTALARDALLDRAARGDSAHALRLLERGLATQLGGPCRVAPAGSPPPAGDAVTIPIERLGQRVGSLTVPPGTEPQRLAPVLATAAELLRLRADPAGDDDGASAYAQLLTAALDGAGTYIWEWDLDSDRLSDVDQGLRMLGYATGALEPTQEAWNALIHPEDLAANHEAYLRHERGETAVYEHSYRARDVHGRWRWLVERGRIVERHPDGRPRRMLGTQSDITERRAIEAAAGIATQRLAGIARHVPGMLFQFERRADGSTAFPYVSERSVALFGLAPAELIDDARALLRLIDPADRPAIAAALEESVRTLQPWRLEFRARRHDEPRDAAPRWMRSEATPLPGEDGAVVWTGYLEDATERRELERAREMAAMAEAANRAKTEFLSRISHELRTPLNAVLGFAQLLEIDTAEPPGPGQQRRLKLIRDAGEHLLQMIGDLLDLTRIESGQMALSVEALDLRALAADAVAMLRGAAETARLPLTLVDGGPAPVLADRTRLRQVVLNLVSNAIKYNRPGGRVIVRVQALAADWQLSVQDTGIGIAERDLPRLFEPFFRGAQTNGAVDGTGIGLAVTQALVVAMGGQIAVDSRLGAGTTFTVTLPAAR